MVLLCSGRLVVVKEQGRMRIGGCPLSDLYQYSNNAFQNTKSFEMTNLTSLQSIDIGQNCFNGASSFSLIGMVERII